MACNATILADKCRGGVHPINLSSHKGPRVRELIEDAGLKLIYLPSYSPDFNPIENAFAKPKALLRKAAKRTVDGLWSAIGELLPAFKLPECRNYFAAAAMMQIDRIPL